jgi:hypothetical protein
MKYRRKNPLRARKNNQLKSRKKIKQNKNLWMKQSGYVSIAT